MPTYTPEDLLRMPNNSTMELVDGQIVEKHVSAESSKIEGRFYYCFQTFLLSHPIAEVYPASLGYQCFDDSPTKIRKPDTTVIRLERLNKSPIPTPATCRLCPISPSRLSLPMTLSTTSMRKSANTSTQAFPLSGWRTRRLAL